jgi:PAS domain S-box-containing protein
MDELQASQHHLTQVLETTAEGIVFVDPNGRVRLANPAAAHILGCYGWQWR